MKGKAVVFTDRLKVSVQEVDIPDATDDDLVIDVTYSWISNGTESSFLRGERISGETMYKEGDPWPFPHVPGYQKVGIVRRIGKNVTGFAVGDTVFASISKVSGMFFPYGGHISPAVTPFKEVWKIPPHVPALNYSGMVLTQVGYNCGSRPGIEVGDFAIVIGDGLVGHWTAQTLHHRGAKVVVLGRHEERLKLLQKEIRAVNVKKTVLQDVLKTLPPIAVVIDTVGDMDTFREIQPFMKRNSHLVSAGFLGAKGLVDIQSLRKQEITLHTPSGWVRERMEETLKGITEGWLKTAPLITHRFPVDEAEAAWKLILGRSKSFMGVILEWNNEGKGV